MPQRETFGKKMIRRIRRGLVGRLSSTLDDSLLLQGRIASWQVRSMKTIGDLSDVEFKVTSQWGDDGIIDWLVERASIPSSAQTFVEFGVETYREANTRFLLQNRNWRGYIMDGSPAMQAATIEDNTLWKYDLNLRHAFIDIDNINDLIMASNFGEEIGLLSIDLDGNDYWIWQAIRVIRPILVVCEYNAVFGDIYPISVPYNPTFDRAGAHSSALYFGASIPALKSLGVKLGYRLLGTNSAANNAFFVRDDYAQRFDGALLNLRSFPSKFRESRDSEGQLTYVSGIERLNLISFLSVINTETQETVKISDLGSVYSEEWLAAMTSAARSS
jgi:hypothetical protein